MKKNQLGRYYKNGKEISEEIKKKIVDLYNEGCSFPEIISRTGVLNYSTIKRAISSAKDGHSEGQLTKRKIAGRRNSISSDSVKTAIGYYKFRKPSISAKKMQDNLLRDGICNEHNLPSERMISFVLKSLSFTRKKLSVTPREAETERNITLLNQYVTRISTLNPFKIYFFDEASVLKTCGNRQYGHSSKGMRAVEIQRYSSNATLTVNLLHGPFGVVYFDIINGPSNGNILVLFFLDVLREVDQQGYPLLAAVDTVIMDNCGFHHGRLTQNHLTQIFHFFGIDLLFQPPYRPELNTCELCFKDIKDYLRRYPTYAENSTEIAICDAVAEITPLKSISFYKNCGYL